MISKEQRDNWNELHEDGYCPYCGKDDVTPFRNYEVVCTHCRKRWIESPGLGSDNLMLIEVAFYVD